jgi:hypothetical protein
VDGEVALELRMEHAAAEVHAEANVAKLTSETI